MLGVAIVLSVLVGGSFSEMFEDYDCSTRETNFCKPPRNRKFPETKEEMDILCRGTIGHLKCVKEKRICDDEGTAELKELKEFISFLETDLCNKDTDMYRAVSSNLPCIGDTWPKSFQCRRGKMENKQGYLESVIRNPLEEDAELDPNQSQGCMNRMFEYACGASVFEKSCGRPVGDALAQILIKTDDEYDLCPREIKEQLPHAMDALRMFEVAEEEAVNAIKRRKK